MPIVEVHLLEGYSADEKHRLGAALTDAVRLVVPAAPEAITVMLREMGADQYYRGGERRSPAPANPDPVALVRGFLTAMQNRDLPAAQAMLGDEFEMQFPGAAPMRELQELVDWAAPRYRFVAKTYEGFEALAGGPGAIVVYCRGTLSGEWPDGTPFEGIRFIDRFELRGGKLTRQDVWNDLAETRAKA